MPGRILGQSRDLSVRIRFEVAPTDISANSRTDYELINSTNFLATDVFHQRRQLVRWACDFPKFTAVPQCRSRAIKYDRPCFKLQSLLSNNAVYASRITFSTNKQSTADSRNRQHRRNSERRKNVVATASFCLQKPSSSPYFYIRGSAGPAIFRQLSTGRARQ